MKKCIIYLVSFVIILTGCRDEGSVSCDPLTKNLLDLKLEEVKAELDARLSQWPPQPTTEDEIGHFNNISLFMETLEDCVSGVSMECYACIETFPPQSEVILVIDSLGSTRQRVLDLFTPSHDVMTLREIHF